MVENYAIEPLRQSCQHGSKANVVRANVVREAIVLIGTFRWVLAALLLAPGGSQLLAQQRNPGSASTAAQTRQSASRQHNLQRLAPGTVFRDCAYCPEMVVVPPGNLTVGSPEGKAGRIDREQTQQPVAISNAIGVGKYEVTRAQFARFVRESGHAASGGCFAWNGSKYEQDASRDWRNPGFAQTDSDPVVCVNWSDAKAYTEWLTKRTGKPYRLPTEAEWEYAARAGDQASRPWGEDASDACRYANVADASAKRDVPGTTSWTFHECDDKHAYTAPVGRYPPNAFGLYDMLGNAWEWTEDCLIEENAGAPQDDRDRPNGACDRRVLRGGAWVDSPAFVRYDFRFFIGPDDRDFYIGFRVVRAD